MMMTTQGRGTLEADVKRLHEIVEQLERKDLELEQAITLFEEGVALLRDAEQRLARAEGRLRQLVGAEGKTRVSDLSLPSDEPR